MIKNIKKIYNFDHNLLKQMQLENYFEISDLFHDKSALMFVKTYTSPRRN